MSQVVYCEHVTKSFRLPTHTVTALSGLTLQVEAGELVTIRGKSGCGKSTLLLTAGGLQRPDSGVVRFQDRDVYEMSADQRAALRAGNIGFVFQQFHLIPYLTVTENVSAASLGVGGRGRNGACQERARELMDRLGLSDRADHRPGQLSIGQCQRVALARALFNEPKLMLADEPTGNLDDENTQIVLDHLRAIADDGAAVLLVTHDRQCDRVADRVLHLRDGQFEP